MHLEQWAKTAYKLFFILAIPSSSAAQMHISGKVLSLPAKEAVPYANIGIENSNLGTISNQDGSFSMFVAQHHLDDTLIFSAIGFERINIPIRQFERTSNLTLYLKETSYRLTEIIVSADRMKKKLITAGNGQFEGSGFYADTVNAGSSMALFIQNKSNRNLLKYQYPVYIQSAQVMIVQNTFESFKVRVRLYDVIMKKGIPFPGQDILNESVVVESQVVNGWLNFDLTPYAVRVESDFFLVFEWIMDKQDRSELFHQYMKFKKENPHQVTVDHSFVDGKKIAFENYQGHFYFGTSFGISIAPAVLRKNICYYRLNSFGQWHTSPSILAAKIRLSAGNGGVTTINEVEPIPSDQNHLLSFYKVRPESKAIDTPSSPTPDSLSIRPFSRRIQEPLEIHVSRNHNRLSFAAVNRGSFPYRLALHFSKIENLAPLISSKEFLVYPGRKELLIFDVVYPDLENYHYELVVSEEIGDISLRPSRGLPYILPVKRMHLSTLKASDNKKNTFYLEAGDTVYAMRKGTVTCTPGIQANLDKIASGHSLEILHSDGTIAVMEGLQPRSNLYEIGDVVFPGNPVALVDSFSAITVTLFEILESEQLKEIPISYYVHEKLVVSFFELRDQVRNLPAILPESLIFKEMTSSEKVKYSRRN